MYTCKFRINANLVKEGGFRINAKLVKEEVISAQKFRRRGAKGSYLTLVRVADRIL